MNYKDLYAYENSASCITNISNRINHLKFWITNSDNSKFEAIKYGFLSYFEALKKTNIIDDKHADYFNLIYSSVKNMKCYSDIKHIADELNIFNDLIKLSYEFDYSDDSTYIQIHDEFVVNLLKKISTDSHKESIHGEFIVNLLKKIFTPSDLIMDDIGGKSMRGREFVKISKEIRTYINDYMTSFTKSKNPKLGVFGTSMIGQTNGMRPLIQTKVETKYE